MGAGGFHGRVRDGIACGPAAMATRSSNARPRVVFDVGFVVKGSGWLPRHPAASPSMLLDVRLTLCAVLGWKWLTVWMIAVRGGCGVGAVRAIRTGQLHALPRFHIRPIDVMVYHGPRGDLVSR